MLLSFARTASSHEAVLLCPLFYIYINFFILRNKINCQTATRTEANHSGRTLLSFASRFYWLIFSTITIPHRIVSNAYTINIYIAIEFIQYPFLSLSFYLIFMIFPLYFYSNCCQHYILLKSSALLVNLFYLLPNFIVLFLNNYYDYILYSTFLFHNCLLF